MNKRQRIFYLFLTLSILSCRNSLRTKKIAYREYYIKGDIKIAGKDTLFNGPIEYYNNSGNLISILNFKENKIDGKATDFYKNGKLKQEEEYQNGLKYGANKIYDTLGRIISESNFYAGLVAGSRTTFKGDSPYLYQFVNLENWPLYTCKYRNNQAIENGNILNYFTYYIYVDGKEKLDLFIYLVNPPHKKITYKLYDKDIKTKDSTFFLSLNSDDGFFQTIQLDLPKENHKYFFQVEAFYPKENVRVRDILKEYQKELRLPDSPGDTDAELLPAM